ncbi:MAG TPA: gamma-glutamyltransferase family protein [Gemmatimonadaceae bacterium]|nr:gamma-glutamyltransferase family protein [Gemmatimonadaceae bacterium]
MRGDTVTESAHATSFRRTARGLTGSRTGRTFFAMLISRSVTNHVRFVALGALVITVSAASVTRAQSSAPRRPITMAGKSPVYAPNGAIATSQPLATTAGLRVLENGGNAIDAAIVAAGVLSVVEPMMTGIGGDLFAIVWVAKEKRLVAINASGRAGSLMTRDELLKRGRTGMQRGPESVTVPGALAGWQALLDKYGTMTLAQALAPAIRYATDGFVVTPVIAADWAEQAALLRRDSGARATFLVRDSAPKAGELFKNPDYAQTLRDVAAQGPAALYGGPLGQRIVDRLNALGGFITLDDLKNNAPNWVTPISTMFKGYRVWELPPNNQGIAVLEMLRMLEPYDLKKMGQNSAAYLHVLIEAKKLAYADLAQFVGDADHVTLTPQQMLSDAFIAERRGHINLKKAATRVAPGKERVSSETIYLSVADKDGNMVSFINSIFDEFGSGIVVPGTGFALHDRGMGFTLTPNLPNTVAPGKRPFHTLIPGFVTRPSATSSPDGTGDEPYMTFGLMGGAMQAQGHVQFLLNHLVFGMDVQQSMDAGRFRHMSGVRVLLEPAIPESVFRALRALGHAPEIGGPREFGGSQAIIKLGAGYVAGSDPRKDGHAGGH